MQKNSLKLLYVLGFILSLAIAFPSYIQSSFIEQFVGLSWVSSFYIAAMVISFFAIIYYPHLIRKISNYRLALYILILYITASLTMAIANSIAYALIAFIAMNVANSLIWISIDIFLEKITPNIDTGKIRTIYFTFVNLGWILTPILMGYITKNNNYPLAFIVSATLVVPVIIILLKQKNQFISDVKYERHGLKKSLQLIRENKSLHEIFNIAFLLQLFYTIAVIYIPIYLHSNLGFDWSVIGIIFAFMLIPFIILEIPAGIAADKYLGEKELLVLGFVILAASTALFFFVQSTNPIVWGLILFLSRCGAALIEAMRETYFFKIVNVENLNFINYFRTTAPLGYIAGSIIGIIVLSLTSIEYIFIILAIILLSGIYFSLKLKDTK